MIKMVGVGDKGKMRIWLGESREVDMDVSRDFFIGNF